LHDETEDLIRTCRREIEDAIARRPEFLKSLAPVEEHEADSPAVRNMVRAGRKAGTGPMASVAGTVAEYVGRGLLQWSREVIVENGGDLFIKVDEPVLVGLFAGSSPFNGRLALRVDPTPLPLGVGTSSGTFGHSLSKGKADAATAVSRDIPLADAVATATGNRISGAGDLKKTVEWALSVPGVEGALAIFRDKIAAVGNLELVPLPESGKNRLTRSTAG
jgi:ApbE superfamily uncharacterized protein (UPF0280 family)